MQTPKRSACLVWTFWWCFFFGGAQLLDLLGIGLKSVVAQSKKYTLQGTNISPYQGTFEDDCAFPQVGDVNSPWRVFPQMVVKNGDFHRHGSRVRIQVHELHELTWHMFRTNKNPWISLYRSTGDAIAASSSKHVARVYWGSQETNRLIWQPKPQTSLGWWVDPT